MTQKSSESTSRDPIVLPRRRRFTALGFFCATAALLAATGMRADRNEQAAPQVGAQVFLPGLVSKGKEMAISFAPDGKTFYFSRREALARDPYRTATIYWTSLEDGGWLDPMRTRISGDYSTVDAVIAPDGERLFFMSSRPVEGVEPIEDSDIWVMNRTGPGWNDADWGPPVRLGINDPSARDGAPAVTRKGMLYFFSERAAGIGSGDLYSSELVAGQYRSAQNLGRPVNSDAWDGHPYVDPEHRFLLFTSLRAGGFGDCDLYISYRRDRWTKPENLGPSVNTEACEMLPSMDPSQKNLFFTRITADDGSNIMHIPVGSLIPSRFSSVGGTEPKAPAGRDGPK